VVAAARGLGGIEGKRFAALVAAYAAVVLIGVPLPYVTDSRALLMLYPLRVDAALNVAIAAIALAWAGRCLTRREEERDTLPFAIALALLIGNMVAVLLMLHAWSRREGRATESRMIAAALALILLLLIAMGLPPRMGDDFAPLSLLFSLAALGAAVADRSASSGPAQLAALTAALACSFVPPAQAFAWPLLALAVAAGSAVRPFRGSAAVGSPAASSFAFRSPRPAMSCTRWLA
jgi:hypothetical protein